MLEHAVELADGTPLPSDVTVWAASFSVPQLAATRGLAVDEIGRLRVDEYLHSIDHPDIIGAGDAVQPPASVGAHLRMSCAMALPLGGHAANTSLAQLRATQPQPLTAGFIIQCISLGRRKGYVQFVHSDDTPRRFHIAGALGAKIQGNDLQSGRQRPAEGAHETRLVLDARRIAATKNRNGQRLMPKDSGEPAVVTAQRRGAQTTAVNHDDKPRFSPAARTMPSVDCAAHIGTHEPALSPVIRRT